MYILPYTYIQISTVFSSCMTQRERTICTLLSIRIAYPSSSIVYAPGIFDPNNTNTLAHIEFCRSLGDILVLGVRGYNDLRRQDMLTVESESHRLRFAKEHPFVHYAFLGRLTFNPAASAESIGFRFLGPDVFVFDDMALATPARVLDEARYWGVKKHVVPPWNY